MRHSCVKNLLWPFAVAGLCLGSTAFAQGSGNSVTVSPGSGPRLGVRVVEVDQAAVSRLKLREPKGARVTEVLDNSAASKAGILKDDVIVRFQGEAVLAVAQFGRLVSEVPSGREVDIDIIRAGVPLRVKATIGSADPALADVGIPYFDPFRATLDETFEMLRDERARFRQVVGPEGSVPTWPPDSGFRAAPPRGLMLFPSGQLGITCTEISGQLAGYFKAPPGARLLVNAVAEGSAAERAGITAGDLILRLGETSVEDTSDLRRAVDRLARGQATRVTVWRSGRSTDLFITVDEVP